MRQFFTLRYWLAVGALVALAVAVAQLSSGGDQVTLAGPTGPAPHRIDVFIRVGGFVDVSNFSIVDGVVRGQATAVASDGRRFWLAPGIPGESTCDDMEQFGGCVLAADLLGDAVVWFSLLPASALLGTEYPLPPIVELLDGVTWARLSNGWEVPLLAVVARRCSTETTSIADFIVRTGLDHQTLLDLDQGEVSAVRCLRAPDPVG